MIFPYNFAQKQISDVKTKHHTPEGTFTGSPGEIADKLLKASGGSVKKARQRITFYINRAGENCSPEVRKAKKILMEDYSAPRYVVYVPSFNFNLGAL